MSKCKSCKGYNASLGDYCITCLATARQIERMESYTDKVSQPKPKGVTVSHSDSPTKTCSRCSKPRAKWSKSYCKQCHALRVKEWRTARHTIWLIVYAMPSGGLYGGRMSTAQVCRCMGRKGIPPPPPFGFGVYIQIAESVNNPISDLSLSPENKNYNFWGFECQHYVNHIRYLK